MTEVWVATEHFPYEGEAVLGVGASMAAAQAICQEDADGRDLRWAEEGEWQAGATGDLVDYIVHRWEVRQ